MKRMAWVALVVAALTAVGPAFADDIQDAMDRAEVLNLLLQVQVSPAQAQRMVAPVQRIQQMVQASQRAEQDRLNRLGVLLQQARTQGLAGKALSPEMQAALDAHEQQRAAARLELVRSVAEQMRLIEGMLTPEQNALLDWTPPGALTAEESLEERTRLQQVALGRIQDAARLLDRIKYLDPFNFVVARVPIVNDYLALHFLPGSAEFQQAFAITINYSDQVRMLTDEQWQAQGLDIGAALIEELGLMPTLDPGPAPGTIAWERLYQILTNPQAVAAVQSIAR